LEGKKNYQGAQHFGGVAFQESSYL